MEPPTARSPTPPNHSTEKKRKNFYRENKFRNFGVACRKKFRIRRRVTEPEKWPRFRNNGGGRRIFFAIFSEQRGDGTGIVELLKLRKLSSLLVGVRGRSSLQNVANLHRKKAETFVSSAIFIRPFSATYGSFAF